MTELETIIEKQPADERDFIRSRVNTAKGDLDSLTDGSRNEDDPRKMYEQRKAAAIEQIRIEREGYENAVKYSGQAIHGIRSVREALIYWAVAEYRLGLIEAREAARLARPLIKEPPSAAERIRELEARLAALEAKGKP